MKTEPRNVLRVILTVVVRLVLAAVAVVGIAALGIYMILCEAFYGPSVTARDQLTLTLMEYTQTRQIPVDYLGQELVDYICAPADSLPDTVSDPALIHLAGQQPSESKSIQGRTFTATVTLQAAAPGWAAEEGNYFAGLNKDGILLLATSEEDAQALGIEGRCNRILMMNGKINEGLMNATSGFAPRMAIGQKADGTVILVRTDGGSWDHPGATYQDLINIMAELGAVNACTVSSCEE